MFTKSYIIERGICKKIFLEDTREQPNSILALFCYSCTVLRLIIYHFHVID